jgi:hypothetical protein
MTDAPQDWLKRIADALGTQGLKIDSEATDWEFKRAASGLYPVMVHRRFLEGAEGILESPPWLTEFEDPLVLAYVIEVDEGRQFLTQAQVDRWPVTRDRIESAGRSLLFHTTREASPDSLDDSPIEAYRVGDGYDAARIIVIEDLHFGEFDADSRIAIPSTEELLFVRSGDDDAVAALKREAQQRYDQAALPLTPDLFKFDRSKPIPA